ARTRSSRPPGSFTAARATRRTRRLRSSRRSPPRSGPTPAPAPGSAPADAEGVPRSSAPSRNSHPTLIRGGEGRPGSGQEPRRCSIIHVRLPRGMGAVLVCAAVLLTSAASASAGTLPTGFQETTAFSGLTNPTVVRFAPDGTVYVAEK